MYGRVKMPFRVYQLFLKTKLVYSLVIQFFHFMLFLLSKIVFRSVQKQKDKFKIFSGKLALFMCGKLYPP